MKPPSALSVMAFAFLYVHNGSVRQPENLPEKRLARALRSERSRGRGGHWTYDLNRHIALSQAYAAERRDLDLLTRGGTK